MIIPSNNSQWPDATRVPDFRSAIQRYTEEVARLADIFKIAVAECLDLEPTAFSRLFDNPSNDRLMLAKYPLPASPQDGDFKGLATHKDSSFLTLLLPGTEHRGLEAQNKAGDWIPVPPLPGHLVVNIGRQLEALTKAVCVATTHRVKLHPRYYHDTNGKSLGTRYAFPYFLVMGLDLTPETASVEVPPHIAALVKDEKVKSDSQAYFQLYFKDGIGRGVFATRALRYPVAAQKFYPGLLEELKGITKLVK
jgi:isopenicillin N synthase-like dioxygenase